MKKSLIALAVAAGTIAAAQADTTTLYGSLGYSVAVGGGSKFADVLDFGDNVWNLNTTTAKIGVEGQEDLDNGMQAFFKYEFGINDRDNNDWNAIAKGDEQFDGSKLEGLTSTKKAYLGLRGDFGQVTFGKMPTLWDATQNKADYLEELGLERDFGVGNASKAINYITPDMSGFKAGASIVLDGDNLRSKGVDVWEVAAMYENNGIEAGIAYQDLAKKHNVLGVSGKYSNDQFSVAADYQHEEVGSVDDNLFSLGGEYNINNQNSLRAAVQYIDNAEAYNVGLGYKYKFSQRTYTWVEGQYHDEKAKDKDAFKAVVGIRHDF